MPEIRLKCGRRYGTNTAHQKCGPGEKIRRKYGQNAARQDTAPRGGNVPNCGQNEASVFDATLLGHNHCLSIHLLVASPDSKGIATPDRSSIWHRIYNTPWTPTETFFRSPSALFCRMKRTRFRPKRPRLLAGPSHSGKLW